MNFNTELLSNLLSDDKILARKVLKAMALVIALETSKGNEVEIEYLGTLGKKGRYWSFKESEYFNIVRSSKMAPIEFLDSILTEDDQLNELSTMYRESNKDTKS